MQCRRPGNAFGFRLTPLPLGQKPPPRLVCGKAPGAAAGRPTRWGRHRNAGPATWEPSPRATAFLRAASLSGTNRASGTTCAVSSTAEHWPTRRALPRRRARLLSLDSAGKQHQQQAQHHYDHQRGDNPPGHLRQHFQHPQPFANNTTYTGPSTAGPWSSPIPTSPLSSFGVCGVAWA